MTKWPSDQVTKWLSDQLAKLMLLITLVVISTVVCAQNVKQVIVLFPQSDYIQEIYYVKVDQPDVKDGDYYSFYEGYLEKSKFKNEKIDEDKIKGIKTRGAYFNNLKDSIWTIYYPPSPDHPTTLNEIKEEGAYVNERKTGVWYTFLEEGKVIKRYNADLKKELNPIIKPRYVYPPKAKAHRAEGIVAVKIFYERCVVKKYKIIKDIGYGCGQSVIDGLKESRLLRVKYGLSDVDCSKKDEIITTRFKL